MEITKVDKDGNPEVKGETRRGKKIYKSYNMD